MIKWLKRLALRWALDPGKGFQDGMFRRHIGKNIMVINAPWKPPFKDMEHDAVEAYVCDGYAVLFYKPTVRWWHQHEIEEKYGCPE